MKAFQIVLLPVLLLVVTDAGQAGGVNRKETYPSADKGFAVVELFTSEGCSSCPPADALVAKIQRESKDKPVYILTYHVDYWNRLGWKDVFSDHVYSARQQQYSQCLGLNGVYTPQVVVNGQKEFVGSKEDKLRSAIQNGLQTASDKHLRIVSVQTKGQQAALRFETDAAADHAVLVVAVVQKSAVTHVKRGENSGQTLSHVQIVRQLQTVPLVGSSGGSAKVELPAGLNAPDAELIAFIQDQRTGAIRTATRVSLEGTGTASAAASK